MTAPERKSDNEEDDSHDAGPLGEDPGGAHEHVPDRRGGDEHNGAKH